MRILVNKENEAILRAIDSTDFKVRYQSSDFGYVWSILKPMFMFDI